MQRFIQPPDRLLLASEVVEVFLPSNGDSDGAAGGLEFVQ
jgi:hypothetical protein